MNEYTKLGFVSQVFRVNPGGLNSGSGHSGVDEVHGYGSPVYALKKGFVYKILDAEHPANDGSGYWGVFIISGDGGWCEWQIGHLSEITCKVGDQVEPWTVIGKEGNRGQVTYNGQIITKAMQDAGNKNGSHRHWNKKPLNRLSYAEYDVARGEFLTAFSFGSPSAFRESGGWYYQVQAPDNGVRGAVDPMDDLLRGYEAVRQHFAVPVEQVITEAEKASVEASIKVAREAIKYPFLWGAVQKILQAALFILRGKKD